MKPDSKSADLVTAWRTLIETHSASTDIIRTGWALVAAWSEPHRRYHNVTHLRDVLNRVDELATHADDPDAVRLAAWYHDVVYRGRADDEDNSARRAERELTSLNVPAELVRTVARLVRLTATHDPALGDRDGETLSDADLAILAAPPDKYADYTAAVRAEYAHVPDEDFRSGRTRVLRDLLNAPAVYRTPYARQRWQAQARTNIKTELCRLTSPAC